MAVLRDAVDPATGSGRHARCGCPGSAPGRLVVVIAGVLLLRSDIRLGEHLEGWPADTNPTASSPCSSAPRSVVAASSTVSSASRSTCSRSSGIAWPLRTERP
jgi:hypothetical protein